MAAGRRWYRILPGGLAVLGLLLTGISAEMFLPGWMQFWAVVVGLAMAGVAGGVLLIPCEAFFQIRPAPEKKGAVIATANFAGFAGMSLSGLFYGIGVKAGLAPLHRLAVLGAMALLLAAWLHLALRKIKT